MFSASPLHNAASFKHKHANSTSCVVYAFVLATAISGPAQVYNTKSDKRARLEPNTFVTANVCALFSFESFNAAKVSAVSPDCETKMHKVFSLIR